MSAHSPSPSTESETTPRPKVQELPPEAPQQLTITLPGGRASTPSSVPIETPPVNSTVSTSAIRRGGSISRRSTTPAPIPPAVRRSARSGSRESTSSSVSSAVAPYARPDKGKARETKGSTLPKERGVGRPRGRGGARGNAGRRVGGVEDNTTGNAGHESGQESIQEEENTADGNTAIPSGSSRSTPTDQDMHTPSPIEESQSPVGLHSLEHILSELGNDNGMPLETRVSLVKKEARKVVRARMGALEEKYQQYEKETKSHYEDKLKMTTFEFKEAIKDQYKRSAEQYVQQQKAKIEEEIRAKYERDLADMAEAYKKRIEEMIRREKEEKHQARLQQFASAVPDGSLNEMEEGDQDNVPSSASRKRQRRLSDVGTDTERRQIVDIGAPPTPLSQFPSKRRLAPKPQTTTFNPFNAAAGPSRQSSDPEFPRDSRLFLSNTRDVDEDMEDTTGYDDVDPPNPPNPPMPVIPLSPPPNAPPALSSHSPHTPPTTRPPIITLPSIEHPSGSVGSQPEPVTGIGFPTALFTFQTPSNFPVGGGGAAAAGAGQRGAVGGLASGRGRQGGGVPAVGDQQGGGAAGGGAQGGGVRTGGQQGGGLLSVGGQQGGGGAAGGGGQGGGVPGSGGGQGGGVGAGGGWLTGGLPAGGGGQGGSGGQHSGGVAAGGGWAAGGGGGQGGEVGAGAAAGGGGQGRGVAAGGGGQAGGGAGGGNSGQAAAGPSLVQRKRLKHQLFKKDIPDDFKGMQRALVFHVKVLWGLIGKADGAVPALPTDNNIAQFSRFFQSKDQLNAQARQGATIPLDESLVKIPSLDPSKRRTSAENRQCDIPEVAMSFIKVTLAKYGLCQFAPDFRQPAYSLYNHACHMAAVDSFRQMIQANVYSEFVSDRTSLNRVDLMVDIYDHTVHLVKKQDWRREIKDPGAANLTFSYYIDWFNPNMNKISAKIVSAGAIVFTLLNLPDDMQHRVQNVFFAGITPPPHEPTSTTMNHLSDPIFDEFERMFPGVSIRTHRHPEGRFIRVAVLAGIGDLPAIRKAMGYAGVASDANMCSMCKIHKSNIDILDPPLPPLRTGDEVSQAAKLWHEATTKKEQQAIFKAHGVRWMSMHRLTYRDPVLHTMLGVMHNWIEGILQNHFRNKWGIGIQTDKSKATPITPLEEHLGIHIGNDDDVVDAIHEDQTADDDSVDESTDTDASVETDDSTVSISRPRRNNQAIFTLVQLTTIRTCIANAVIPSWVERPPRNIGEASHGKLKADTWLSLFSVFLPLIIPEIWRDADYLELRRNFYNIVACTNIYRKSSLNLFSAVKTLPNDHFAMHIGDLLKYWGPLIKLSEFPGEQHNGTLQKINTNHHLQDLDFTMMHQICRRGRLQALVDKNRYPSIIRDQDGDTTDFDMNVDDTQPDNLNPDGNADRDENDRQSPQIKVTNPSSFFPSALFKQALGFLRRDLSTPS
ncbi:hypothetical protein CVT24_011676, partial [Panaeolus cyanescens]